MSPTHPLKGENLCETSFSRRLQKPFPFTCGGVAPRIDPVLSELGHSRACDTCAAKGCEMFPEGETATLLGTHCRSLALWESLSARPSSLCGFQDG